MNRHYADLVLLLLCFVVKITQFYLCRSALWQPFDTIYGKKEQASVILDGIFRNERYSYKNV